MENDLYIFSLRSNSSLDFFQLNTPSEQCRALEEISIFRFFLQKMINASLTEKIKLHIPSMISYLTMTN